MTKRPYVIASTTGISDIAEPPCHFVAVDAVVIEEMGETVGEALRLLDLNSAGGGSLRETLKPVISMYVGYGKGLSYEGVVKFGVDPDEIHEVGAQSP